MSRNSINNDKELNLMDVLRCVFFYLVFRNFLKVKCPQLWHCESDVAGVLMPGQNYQYPITCDTYSCQCP